MVKYLLLLIQFEIFSGLIALSVHEEQSTTLNRRGRPTELKHLNWTEELADLPVQDRKICHVGEQHHPHIGNCWYLAGTATLAVWLSWWA